MKSQNTGPAFALLAGLLLLAGCSATRLQTQAQLPPPLIDKLPVRVGIHYSKEFAEYVHKETRTQIDYEVTLGPAHVINLNWLLGAMFAEVVPVDDPTRVADVKPPLLFVLEPKFEEYSFLTPRDVAGEAYIVTIRYLLTLYDGSGGRVDSFTYTGYGREKARKLASKEPLQIATQRAMRDAGAKVAVEFVDQESVRLLLRNPLGTPAAVSAGGLPPANVREAPVVKTAPSAPAETKPGDAAPQEEEKPAEPPESETVPPPAGDAPEEPQAETPPPSGTAG